jgi:hypothetical protein
MHTASIATLVQMLRRRVLAVSLMALGFAPSLALAQEATNTPAATQPAEGNWYLRQKFQYISLRDDPSTEKRDVDKGVATTSLTYGLRRDISLSLDLPLVYAREISVTGTDRDFGVNDFVLTVKYRPVQIDLNPIDSVRFAVFGGVEVPSGDGDFSSHSFDPFVGGVFTAILGRHGFNQSLSYKFNTGGDPFSTRAGDGPDDALRYDTAYLYRIDPAEYSAETSAATYVTLELNGLYETGGDNEILLGPGILYEARTFALEATVGFPIVEDVDDRPETELVVSFGFRILF